MPRRQSLRRRLADLLKQYQPESQKAFLEAINEIRNDVVVAELIRRLERGRVDQALDLLRIEPAAFRQFEEAIRQAYIGGGTSSIAELPRVRDPAGGFVQIRFDTHHPTAERFLETLAGTRIVGISTEARDIARTHMSTALNAGRNPRSVALDLVGRRQGSRRVGGIIGIDAEQYRVQQHVRTILADPDRIREYFIRDRVSGAYKPRWNSTPTLLNRDIAAAIREGRALSPDQVERFALLHQNNLLRIRGERIARTETLGALNSSKSSAAEQMIDAGGIARQNVKKRWIATNDSRTRDTHAALNGELVGIDEPFSNGLMYPCEPGGDPSEIIQCRCTYTYVVDHMAGLE